MPERTLMGIVARTAYWVEWWRRFGPPSGNAPKLKDPFGRYVLTTFVKGTNMGPYEAAKHIPGVPGHELSYVANRHFSIALLNEAVADLVNAHARLDISQAWGDGTAVAADGTHMDTYLNNRPRKTPAEALNEHLLSLQEAGVATTGLSAGSTRAGPSPKPAGQQRCAGA
ncbi:MAG: Tn3 family transposase [Streptomyces sp.]